MSKRWWLGILLVSFAAAGCGAAQDDDDTVDDDDDLAQDDDDTADDDDSAAWDLDLCDDPPAFDPARTVPVEVGGPLTLAEALSLTRIDPQYDTLLLGPGTHAAFALWDGWGDGPDDALTVFGCGPDTVVEGQSAGWTAIDVASVDDVLIAGLTVTGPGTPRVQPASLMLGDLDSTSELSLVLPEPGDYELTASCGGKSFSIPLIAGVHTDTVAAACKAGKPVLPEGWKPVAKLGVGTRDAAAVGDVVSFAVDLGTKTSNLAVFDATGSQVAAGIGAGVGCAALFVYFLGNDSVLALAADFFAVDGIVFDDVQGREAVVHLDVWLGHNILGGNSIFGLDVRGNNDVFWGDAVV